MPRRGEPGRHTARAPTPLPACWGGGTPRRVAGDRGAGAVGDSGVAGAGADRDEGRPRLRGPGRRTRPLGRRGENDARARLQGATEGSTTLNRADPTRV